MRTFEADKKESVVRLLIAPDLKKKAEVRAKRQGMTLSKYIRTLIEEDLMPPKIADAVRQTRNYYTPVSKRDLRLLEEHVTNRNDDD
jgi:hypothetical protein